MNMALLILVALLPSLIVADHLSVPDHNLEHLKCDLECHHNGVCRFLTRERHGLQKLMQAGHLIQQCVCPMGYRGMGCDVDLEEHPCNNDGSNPKDCDCAAADKLSVFAGEQCRKPFTEYCVSLQDSVGGHISYCTNGGKCRGDLLAAQISPGNTTNNFVFQHAGCVCPPEFIGEHCEILNTDGIHHPELHRQHPTTAHTAHESTKESDKSNTAIAVVCVGALAVLGFVLMRKLRHRRTSCPQTELALNSYSDHQMTYDDNRDDSSSGSDEEDAFFECALPDLA